MIGFHDELRARAAWLPNRAGARVFGVFCEAREHEPKGLVVLAPGYERCIHHASALSRELVRHGYATLRFDLTNHVGMSDGEVRNFTLSSMIDDIAGVLAACGERFGAPLFLVAPSLAARAAIRALVTVESLQERLDALVLVLPVVDTELTLATAIGRNVLEDWRRGTVTADAICRVLEHDVEYEFSRDALEQQLDGLERARTELGDIAVPVTAIAAEHDDWVRVADVQHAMAGAAPAPRSTIVLEATSHDLAHNPPVMRLLVQRIVGALRGADGATASPGLGFDEIVETVAIERQWRRDGYRQLAVGALA